MPLFYQLNSLPELEIKDNYFTYRRNKDKLAFHQELNPELLAWAISATTVLQQLEKLAPGFTNLYVFTAHLVSLKIICIYCNSLLLRSSFCCLRSPICQSPLLSKGYQEANLQSRRKVSLEEWSRPFLTEHIYKEQAGMAMVAPHCVSNDQWTTAYDIYPWPRVESLESYFCTIAVQFWALWGGRKIH